MDESKHFTLEKLASGVFAAIHRPGGWAIANAGIIDLGGATLVFDTFLTPEAALDLRTSAEAVTGMPVEKVVNSHYHNDHTWGNQVFRSQADIISSIETRRLLETKGREEYERCRDDSSSNLDAWHTKLDAEVDDQKRRDIRDWIAYYEALVHSMPTLQVCPSDLAFAERLEIVGTRRHVELIAFTNGHTGSDTILYSPNDQIIFMGDLLFVGWHPFLGDGDPNNLLTSLSRIQDLDAEFLIPGHGPVGTQDDIDLMGEYVESCHRAAEALVAQGAPSETPAHIAVPAQFRDWRLPGFHEMNVRAMHKALLDRA